MAYYAQNCKMTYSKDWGPRKGKQWFYLSCCLLNGLRILKPLSGLIWKIHNITIQILFPRGEWIPCYIEWLLFTSLLFYSKAKVLDVSRISCLKIKDLIPDTQDGLFVFYIKMDGIADFITWKHLATCLRMWDLDARGFHKGMWRFWLKKNHVIVVGCPTSKYCTHKPENLEPLYIPETVKRPLGDEWLPTLVFSFLRVQYVFRKNWEENLIPHSRPTKHVLLNQV